MSDLNSVKLARLLDKHIIPDLSDIVLRYIGNRKYYVLYRELPNEEHPISETKIYGIYDSIEDTVLNLLKYYLTKDYGNFTNHYPTRDIGLNSYNYDTNTWIFAEEQNILKFQKTNDENYNYFKNHNDFIYNFHYQYFHIDEFIPNEIVFKRINYDFIKGKLKKYNEDDFEMNETDFNFNYEPLNQFNKQICELLNIDEIDF